MSDTRQGGCLCGAIRFEAELSALHYHACHCATCRGWGGPAMAVAATGLTIEDTAALRHFDSSDYGQRGFCAECGSHLYWRMKDGSMTAIWIGALDDDAGLAFSTELFIDSKPGHYAFANDTTKLTAEEVFAHFGGGG